jgi:hypothetical protein
MEVVFSLVFPQGAALPDSPQQLLAGIQLLHVTTHLLFAVVSSLVSKWIILSPVFS